MNRDDIIRMAQEAGHHVPYAFTLKQLEAFAALVASAKQTALLNEGWRPCALGQRTPQQCALSERAVSEEREACAQMCEAYMAEGIGREMARAIRARGEE